MNKNKSGSWRAHVNETVVHTGTLHAHDKTGVPVVLEWKTMGVVSQECSELMARVADIGITAYMPVEMDFLRKYPEVVGKEPYFKLFEQLFEYGPDKVDWTLAEKTMASLLKAHFVFDVTQLPPAVVAAYANDLYVFVEVKDAVTGTTFGFTTFLIKNDFEYGAVKTSILAVVPSAQNRGLAKLLVSSIFVLVPDTQHLFLSTRVTNANAIRAYRSWGFEPDKELAQDAQHAFNPDHWIFLAYKAQTCDTLQKMARTMNQ